MYRLSLKEKLIYACGGFGSSMVGVIHMLYLVYYFFPPKDAGIPYFVPQKAIFLGFTILGIIMAAGRLFDAFTDPLIASLSDNSNFRKGKRIPFMRVAAIGFAASTVMVFFVPQQQAIASVNTIWLALWLGMTALFLTLYIVPQTALMVEIAYHPDDKIDLATLNSILWFAGFLIVSFSGSAWGILQNRFGFTRAEAMRLSFVVLSAIGGIVMLIPAFAIDENKYKTLYSDYIREKRREKQPLIPAMKQVFSNRDFTVYVFGSTMYYIATYIFESGLIYYITVLAGFKPDVQGPITTVVGAVTLASYPFVNKYAKKLGKKKILNAGFILFALMFGAILMLGVNFIPVWFAMVLVMIFAPVPQSIFGTLPNAITGDCASWDRENSGEDHAGMYFAVNGFVHKLGATTAILIFTSLLLLGKDPGNDIGIRLAALTGGVLSIAGLLIMTKYNEKRILQYAQKDEEAVSESAE